MTGEDVDQLWTRGDRLVRTGRLEMAAGVFQAALALAPDRPELHSNLGGVFHALGRFAEAAACHRRALALGLEHPVVLTNLGTALRAAGETDAAAAALRRALALAPDHAPAHNNLGNVLRDLDRLPEAAEAYLAALSCDSADAEASLNLAAVLGLLQTRDRPAAVALAARWLALTPADPTAIHMAAALGCGAVPARAADGYVRGLFDGFAPAFDERLAALDYQAPALMAAALARLWPQPHRRLVVLDAGCGTGLCGPALRPYAGLLVGVDLSSGMLARAAARGVYNQLVEEELGAFLSLRPGLFDLIAAGDVLCYFGVLDSVLAAAAAALRPGGVLLFTLERAAEDGPGFVLQGNGRYRHTPLAVATALERAGFAVREQTRVTLRTESGVPVPGLLVCAELPPGVPAASAS